MKQIRLDMWNTFSCYNSLAMSDMTIIYEIVLDNNVESTYRFLDMTVAHQYMMQLMKNSMGFSFCERDVKTDGKAHQCILSKQEMLNDIANGTLPFDTRVSKPNVKKAKTEETKTEETKTEETKAKETKTEETKTEEINSKETEAKETNAKETKAKETKVEESKVEESKTIPTGCIYKMMRGERKGESCNKPCSKDSTFCKTHK